MDLNLASLFQKIRPHNLLAAVLITTRYVPDATFFSGFFFCSFFRLIFDQFFPLPQSIGTFVIINSEWEFVGPRNVLWFPAGALFDDTNEDKIEFLIERRSPKKEGKNFRVFRIFAVDRLDLFRFLFLSNDLQTTFLKEKKLVYPHLFLRPWTGERTRGPASKWCRQRKQADQKQDLGDSCLENKSTRKVGKEEVCVQIFMVRQNGR